MRKLLFQFDRTEYAHRPNKIYVDYRTEVMKYAQEKKTDS